MKNKKLNNFQKMLIKAFELKRMNDFAGAFSLIENYLSKKNSSNKNEAIALRARLKEEENDFKGAKEDYLKALALTRLNYPRYTLELTLGAICERQGNIDEALLWYLKALITSIRAKNISGGSALRSFLTLREKMSDDERALCIKAAKKSWKVLQLPGEPDLSNLRRVADTLIKEGGKIRKIEK